MNTKHILAAAAAALFAGGASAATVPVWQPTDGDINTITVEGTAAGYSFAIFDDDDIGNENLPGTDYLAIAPNYDTIYVTQSGGDWVLSNAGGSLTLSGNDHFVFGTNQGAGWNLNSGRVEAFPEKIYQVEFLQGAETSFTAIDVKPATVVPVPAPLALLGSGLVGLVAVGRRRASA